MDLLVMKLINPRSISSPRNFFLGTWDGMGLFRPNTSGVQSVWFALRLCTGSAFDLDGQGITCLYGFGDCCLEEGVEVERNEGSLIFSFL